MALFSVENSKSMPTDVDPLKVDVGCTMATPLPVYVASNVPQLAHFSITEACK